MPQLDFATYPSQIFWLLTIFGVLWAVMGGVVLSPVSKIISKRNETFQELAQQAHDLHRQAQELRDESARLLAACRFDCEQRLQTQLREHEALVKQAKLLQSAKTRHELKEMDRHFAALKKEIVEEGIVLLPELETLLLEKLSDIYTQTGGTRAA
jgi:F-type H+-transporting ATPase subunit b